MPLGATAMLHHLHADIIRVVAIFTAVGVTVCTVSACSLAIPLCGCSLLTVLEGRTRCGYTCITSRRNCLDLNGGEAFNLVSYASPSRLHGTLAAG